MVMFCNVHEQSLAHTVESRIKTGYLILQRHAIAFKRKTRY